MSLQENIKLSIRPNFIKPKLHQLIEAQNPENFDILSFKISYNN